MDAAARVPLRRDLLRAVLLTVAMLGIPTAGWAAVGYHKHVRGLYWAYRWSRSDNWSFSLREKLWDMDAPPSVRAVAWKAAYQFAVDKNKRRVAAYNRCASLGLRGLYDLARAAGPGSAEDEALCDRLAYYAPYFDDFADGLSNVVVGCRFPDNDQQGPDCKQLWVRYDFGSYHVEAYAYWERSLEADKLGPWDIGPLKVSTVVTRLPGPWRKLPPPAPEVRLYDSSPL